MSLLKSASNRPIGLESASKAIFASIVIASSMFLASCQNDLEGVKVQETPKAETAQAQAKLVMPETVNGRLVFKDIKDFERFMDVMHANKIATIDSTFAANRFSTLKAKRDDLETTKSEAQRNEMIEKNEFVYVPDSRFAAVLNEDGMIQIGNEIHKVTQNKVYTASVENEALLFAKQPNHPSLKVSEVKYHKIKDSNTNAESRIGEFRGNINTYVSGNLGTKDGRSTRCDAEIWHVKYTFYTSLGARTTAQKDTRLLGWSRFSAKTVGVTAEALGGVFDVGDLIYIDGGTRVETRSDFMHDTAEREVVLFYTALGFIYFSYINTTHFVEHPQYYSASYAY